MMAVVRQTEVVGKVSVSVVQLDSSSFAGLQEVASSAIFDAAIPNF